MGLAKSQFFRWYIQKGLSKLYGNGIGVLVFNLLYQSQIFVMHIFHIFQASIRILDVSFANE